MPVTEISGLELSPLPANGIYRLSQWRDPLDPPPPPASLDATNPELDSSGRWDAPEEEFSTLYCATEAEGCFGEKLGPFIPNPEAALAIEEFFDEDPDPEFATEALTSGLDREDVARIDWKLVWAPVDPEARTFDVTTRRTWIALLPSIATILTSVGLPLNKASLKSSRRSVTRRVAGKLYEASRDDDGDLRAHGIKYESRRPPAWECWALWEPLPIEVDQAEVEEVTIDHPALRSAAAKLGVPLYS